MDKDHDEKGVIIVSTSVEMNRKRAIQLTNALLSHSYFEGFSFDTSFTLRFGKNSLTDFEGKVLPMRVELHLLNNWWLYSKEEWENRLLLFPFNESIEPEEPVQAFELANLRWFGESIIESVLFDNERLLLSFKNGKVITISCEPTEGESWILCEYGLCDEKISWSVVCENGELFVRTQ